MFSKSKDKDTPTQSHTAAPSKRGKSAPSIFSSDLTIRGELHSEGDIQIDGNIEGNIRSGSITIGEKAIINGDVVANEVTVRGRVVGSIRARRVQLSGSCHVEGDILHSSLAVETGAFFDGNCRHAEDPLTAEMPRGMGGQARVMPDTGKVKSTAAPVASNGKATPQPVERPTGAKALPSALSTPRN